MKEKAEVGQRSSSTHVPRSPSQSPSSSSEGSSDSDSDVSDTPSRKQSQGDKQKEIRKKPPAEDDFEQLEQELFM